MLDDELEDLEINNQRKIRDIIERHNRELREEKIKYDQALEQQAVEEQRKRDDLALWLQQEVDDFNEMWRQKNEDLTDKMSDAIDIYESGMQRILEINQTIAQLMAQGVAGAAQGLFSFVGAPSIPGAVGGFFGLGGRLGGGSNIGGLQYQYPLAPDPGGGGGTASIQQLINLATNLALEHNMPNLLSQINSATYPELVEVIDMLQSLPDNAPGAQFGSHVTAGVPRTVGEAGPETFIPTQGGIIAPHQAFMVSPQSQTLGTITNDNSRNVSADISLLDPTHLSEIQRTLNRTIVTEQLISLGI